MRRHPRFSDLPRALPLLAVVLVGACSEISKFVGPKGSTASAVAQVAVVQGDQQVAQAGKLLGTPIVLRLVDETGAGVSGQATTLIVASGGGTVTPTTAVSDSIGELNFQWTLGTATVAQTLSASVDGVAPVTVSATALFPSSLVVAQGNSQTAKVATALKSDIVVRVQGGNGVPMVGVTVTFRVTAGGGAITPQSGQTNSAGEFSGKWTLGGVAGANTVVAESGSLSAATINATATP